MDNQTEVARCRNCHAELIGKPDYAGGTAYHPVTKERCPRNFYGGFVCSEDCDRKVLFEMESSMPGAGIARTLSTFAQRSLRDNWESAK